MTRCGDDAPIAMTLRIVLNGRPEEVTVEAVQGDPTRYRMTYAGRTEVIDCVAAGDRRYSLLRPDASHASAEIVVAGAGTPGELTVQVGHAVFHASVDGRRARAAGPAAGPADVEQRVAAPMPGKVLQVLVAPGDEVEAGQGLVVVEAMKMENEIGSPRAGRVVRVEVEPGMSVEAGRTLLVVG